MVTVVLRTHCQGWSLLPLLLTLLLPVLLPAQLVGQRGVISLPDNFEYRDEDTRLAAEAVAGFAQQFQRVANQEATLNLQRSRQQKKLRSDSTDGLAFFTEGVRSALPGGNNDDFFHDTSRFIRPPLENAQRIDNEHPCTLARQTCDVPEALLIEALRKKAQSPENEEGIINALDGLQPDFNINPEIPGQLGAIRETFQSLSFPQSPSLPSSLSLQPSLSLSPSPAPVTAFLPETANLQAFTSFDNSPHSLQPPLSSHQTFTTFDLSPSLNLGGLTETDLSPSLSIGGLSETTFPVSVSGAGSHRAFGSLGHNVKSFTEANLQRSDSLLRSHPVENLGDVQSALEILGDDDGSFSSFVHFG